MKKIIFLLMFFTSAVFVNGQNCTTGSSPTDIYYPNSTTTPTNVQGPEYLCGPNTIVYDTINSGCHFVYVNAACTLIFKYGSCAAISNVWLKNGSTLNILQGTSPFQIFYEPGATIINSFSIGVSSFSCSSISFPTVNCTITSVKENNFDNDFEIYPNPANDKLNIVFSTNQKEFTIAQIINSLGVLVKETDVTYNEAKSFINVADLPIGVYILNLKNNASTVISKRFTIAK